MENKYYIPDISEFKYGLEFEVNFPGVDKKENWIKCTFKLGSWDSLAQINFYLTLGVLRIKCLDKNIESELEYTWKI